MGGRSSSSRPVTTRRGRWPRMPRSRRTSAVDHPFWGFPRDHPQLDRAREEGVPTLAAEYVRQIRTIQGEGPYLLSGNCAGGYMAWETARQLLAGGDEIAGLLLYEAPLREDFAELLPGVTPAHVSRPWRLSLYYRPDAASHRRHLPHDRALARQGLVATLAGGDGRGFRNCRHAGRRPATRAASGRSGKRSSPGTCVPGSRPPRLAYAADERPPDPPRVRADDPRRPGLLGGGHAARAGAARRRLAGGDFPGAAQDGAAASPAGSSRSASRRKTGSPSCSGMGSTRPSCCSARCQRRPLPPRSTRRRPPPNCGATWSGCGRGCWWRAMRRSRRTWRSQDRSRHLRRHGRRMLSPYKRGLACPGTPATADQSPSTAVRVVASELGDPSRHG